MKRTLVFQASGVTALLLLLAAAPSHSQAQPSSMTEDAAHEFCTFKLGAADLPIEVLVKIYGEASSLDAKIDACAQDTLKKGQSLAQAEEQWKQLVANTKAQQCKDATQKLQAKGQLGNVQTLVKNDCAILHKAGWLTEGTGKVNVQVCAPPFRAIFKAKRIEASQTYVRLGCATTP